MRFYEYEWMLKRARERLPKELWEDKRFEIPEPMSFVQGNKTILRNLTEIADKLSREPLHLLKFLAKELGAPGDMVGHRAVFQGRFRNSQIRDKVQEYVKEFVICPQCGKPDTKIIKEGRIHLLKCMACGATKPIRSI